MIDFAKRVTDHQYRIDPIIRFLTDIDFYKLSQLQLIWANHFNKQASFEMFNRTTAVKLGEEIDLDELRAQLDHVKGLKWTQQELNFLRAQDFYGRRDLFRNGFLDYLEHSWKLSPYHLEKHDDQIELTFTGSWAEVTMWEIYALAIVNEMRSRYLMRDMDQMSLDLMYSKAKIKLHRKLKRVVDESNATISEFGTRRRHSHLWQDYVVRSMIDRLGDQFVGTSNVYLAMKYGVKAIGTSAHELPMAYVGMRQTPDTMRQAQYDVCRDWQEFYRDGMRIILPDAYGTTQFLKNAPSYLASWKGARPDSKEPVRAAEEFIEWWNFHGEDPTEKMIIFSDGMDVHLDGHTPHGNDIVELHNQFKDRIIPTFGWGTMATNDFYDCHDDPNYMRPISLVCKLSMIEGRPAVKLSDNYLKQTASDDDAGRAAVQRYREVFGHEGMDNAPVEV